MNVLHENSNFIFNNQEKTNKLHKRCRVLPKNNSLTTNSQIKPELIKQAVEEIN